jgi:hypothetical protein
VTILTSNTKNNQKFLVPSEETFLFLDCRIYVVFALLHNYELPLQNVGCYINWVNNLTRLGPNTITYVIQLFLGSRVEGSPQRETNIIGLDKYLARSGMGGS